MAVLDDERSRSLQQARREAQHRWDLAAAAAATAAAAAAGCLSHWRGQAGSGGHLEGAAADLLDGHVARFLARVESKEVVLHESSGLALGFRN